MSDPGKQRWQFFFEQSPVALIEWDLNWCIRSWNPAAEKIFGWTKEEAIGQSYQLIVPTSIRDQIETVTHEITSLTGGRRSSNQNITKAGDIIDCEWYNTALVDDQENVIGAMSVAQDVTQTLATRRRVISYSQRLSELNSQLLKLSQSKKITGQNIEATLREITEVAARGMNVARTSCWVLSEDKKEMLPLTSFDLGTQGFIEAYPLKISQYERFFESLEKDKLIAAQFARSEPRTREFTTLHFAPEGIASKLAVATRLRGALRGMICFEHIGLPREWSSGEQVFAGAIADVISLAFESHERQKAEDEQKRLESQLFQSQKMEALGTLAGGIAHDFNNILAAILGCTELALVRAQAGQSPLEQLSNINKSALRARDIVQQILSFSKKQPIELKPINLQLAVEDALKLIRTSFPASIELQISLEAPDATVMSSSIHVHQLLLNLCTNAVQACQDHKGTLQISLEPVSFLPKHDASLLPHPALKYGDYVRLSISDNGMGIDPDTVKFIFDPFFTTKEPGHGTGLGLSIVHSIMASHNGAVTVQSIKKMGTTFTLYFPKEHVLAPEEAEADEIEFGNGERILLIDDNYSVLHAGEELLKYLGYSVTAFNGPKEGLEAFIKDPDGFSLIITDLSMPKITGVDIAKSVRALRSDIPVILTTGFGFDANVEEHQFTETLTKPFLLIKLSQAVRRALQKTA